MGAFDDLVPTKQKGTKFDDLIPAAKAAASAQPASQGYFADRLNELKAAGNGVRYGVADTAASIGSMIGAMSPQDTAAYQQRRTQAAQEGGAAFGGGSMAGNLATTLLVPESKVAALGRVGKYLANTGIGAGIGAMQPVADGESRLGNAGKGAVAGLLGQAAGDVVGGIGSKAAAAISPQARALWETAKAHGINLTPAQVSDSPLIRTMSSAFNKLPFSGGVGVMKSQQGAFNAAVGKSFGADGATSLTDGVMTDAKHNLGSTYDSLFGRNNVTLDEPALNRLGSIQQEATNLPPEHAAIVNKQVNDLLGMSNNGVIPGNAYQAFRVDRLKKLQQGSQQNQPFMAGLLGDLRNTIEGAANRSMGPADAGLLADTNRQYSNMKVAQKALKQVAGSGGDVRPASLWPIVNQRQGSTEEMRTLARLGQGMKDTIPDSGTAQRQLMYHMGANAAGLLGGGYAATSDNPLIRDVGLIAAGGVVGGRVLNSPKLTGFLMRNGRGQFAQRVAPLFPYVGLGASSLLGQH